MNECARPFESSLVYRITELSSTVRPSASTTRRSRTSRTASCRPSARVTVNRWPEPSRASRKGVTTGRAAPSEGHARVAKGWPAPGSASVRCPSRCRATRIWRLPIERASAAKPCSAAPASNAKAAERRGDESIRHRFKQVAVIVGRPFVNDTSSARSTCHDKWIMAEEGVRIVTEGKVFTCRILRQRACLATRRVAGGLGERGVQ